MRKAMTFILTLTFILPLTFAVVHANQPIGVTIDGQRVAFQGQQPTIVDGRTLVPVRGVFEQLGFGVGWDPDLRQATLTRADAMVVIAIDSAIFTTNGVSHILDVPAQIIGGSTMIPLRAVLESVGYDLDWDSATSTVLISTVSEIAEPRLLVNGAEWDLTDTITIGGVIMVAVDLLPELGLNGSTNTRFIYWSLSLGDRSFSLNEGHTSFWIWHWQNNRGQGVRNVQLDLPIIVYNQTMYIPLGAVPQIMQTMNERVSVEVIQPALPAQGQNRVTRGGDASVLWAAYSHLSVQNLVDAGYTRQDINYIFDRTRDYRNEANAERNRLAHSSITLPNRRLTDTERQEWIADYIALGGPTANELEVIRLVNIERANHNLSQVAMDEVLMMAARFYAQQAHDLQGLHTGSHNFGPYATNPDARHGASANVAAAFGGRLRWNGGNWFGGGSMTAEDLVQGWMNSDGHRRYILSPEHRFIGIGQFPGGISYLFLSDNASTR